MQISLSAGTIIRCVFLAIMVGLVSGKTVPTFIATVTWRIMAVIAIVGMVIWANYDISHVNIQLIFLLLLHSFILIPIFAPGSFCHKCGRRVYWKPLISNRCQCCGEILW